MMTIGTTIMLSIAAARGRAAGVALDARQTPGGFAAALATQRAMVASVPRTVGPLRAP